MMWHPTRVQWHLIWASTLVFLLLWLTTDPEPEAFFLPFMAVGALFAWNCNAKYEGTEDRE